jgi:zinc and cadmium transporter
VKLSQTCGGTWQLLHQENNTVTTFLWIFSSGILMSAIALVGSLTLFLSEATLKKFLLPLVALAAGTLLGGALLHMIPAAIEKSGNQYSASLCFWLSNSFSTGITATGRRASTGR